MGFYGSDSPCHENSWGNTGMTSVVSSLCNHLLSLNPKGLRSSPNSSGSMGTPTWNGPGSSSQGRV